MKTINAQQSADYRRSFGIGTESKSNSWITYLTFTAWWVSLLLALLTGGQVLGIEYTTDHMVLWLLATLIFTAQVGFFLRYTVDLFKNQLHKGFSWLGNLFKNQGAKDEVANNTESEKATPQTSPLATLLSNIFSLGLAAIISLTSAKLVVREFGGTLITWSHFYSEWFLWGALLVLAATTFALMTQGRFYYGNKHATDAMDSSQKNSSSEPKHYRGIAEWLLFTNVFINFACLTLVAILTGASWVMVLMTASIYALFSLISGRKKLFNAVTRIENSSSIDADFSTDNKLTLDKSFYRSKKFWLSFTLAIIFKSEILLLPTLIATLEPYLPLEYAVIGLGAMTLLALCGWSYQWSQKQPKNGMFYVLTWSLTTLLSWLFIFAIMAYAPLNPTTMMFLTIAICLVMSLTSTLILFEATCQLQDEKTKNIEHTQIRSNEINQRLSYLQKFQGLAQDGTIVAKSSLASLSAFVLVGSCCLILIESDSIARNCAASHHDEWILDSWWFTLLLIATSITVAYVVYKVNEIKLEDVTDAISECAQALQQCFHNIHSKPNELSSTS